MLMKVSLHEIDVSGCSHDYGPDGTKEIAQALNGKEWCSMQAFHPYVESGSEPNGLLQLAIAALRHKSMRVFRIRVKGQEDVVQQAMRTTNLRGTNVSELLLKTCCTHKRGQLLGGNDQVDLCVDPGHASSNVFNKIMSRTLPGGYIP